jgi:hypothetical protein
VRMRKWRWGGVRTAGAAMARPLTRARMGRERRILSDGCCGLVLRTGRVEGEVKGCKGKRKVFL